MNADVHANLQRDAAKEGADRERKRIRRALMALRNRLVRVASSAIDSPDRGFWRNGIDELDAATRAPKKRGAR
jgi:hypothetical protein